MTVLHTTPPAALAADVAEDLQTRWVPDVIADADLPEAIENPRLGPEDVRMINVPRADGGTRLAPVLSGGALAALRESVLPLREVSDGILAPGVCGYRIGADGSSSYSQDYRRFRSWAEALSDESAYVVIADVRNFFDSVTPESASEALEIQFGGRSGRVRSLLSDLQTFGVSGLPAGYGDARLIANCILAVADEQIRVPFTRWVDDYRIFASTEHEAQDVIRRLDTALGKLGLELNEKKVAVMSRDEYRGRRHGVPLDSVYHPQDEPQTTVCASLRSVFARAASSADRRQLRFALPRLAEQGDSVAVEYALKSVAMGSIDSPRLVAYLSHFLGDVETRESLQQLGAEPGLSEWTFMRIAPLLARVPLAASTRDALRSRVSPSHSQLVSGMAMRVLAIHGDGSQLERFLAEDSGVDRRSLVASCCDLGIDIPHWLRESTPSAFAAAERLLRQFPSPASESLL